MNEYRKSVPLKQDNEYWFVELGPIPNQPAWHQELYKFQAYPFPRYEAARRFALSSRERDWDREIAIRHPDGTQEQIDKL